ncbi:nuclear transport factor 2 family protein [Telluribacter sp. SYSU D00476]|uniref:nuclear transport factor 2 family protein n=1 Tax=Telluribacter sp. SYSU D00476 TaxID=2811430 RepID=UPI001FF0DF5F|nr:nuclear transport factor 2 family protein [Telluribacter sp. SYSU D00476]
MTEEQANQFAEHWINSWNSHDLDAIMEHYSNEVEFHSPMITLLKVNDQGLITNKDDLKSYFRIGLNAFPDLHFRLHNVFTGVNTVVLYYTSVNGRKVTEVFEMDDEGKARRVLCNYSASQSNY